MSGDDTDEETVITAFNKQVLTEDTIKYLPITYSVNELNEIIRKTPHDLNGFTLIFMFVVPEDYYYRSELEIDNEYVLDVGDSCINFNNFINGTLIICRRHR